MNIYRNIFFGFFLMLCIMNSAQAQTFYKTDTTNSFNRNSTILNNKRLGFSVDFGFGFFAGNNNASGTYTYVAPYLSYMVTPKFKLDAGAVISNGFNSFYYNQPCLTGSNNTNYFLFARGNYLLTDKVTISGTFYKAFGPTNAYSSEADNKKIFNNAGMSVGLEYKINKRMAIGAQVSVSNGGDGNYFFRSQPDNFGGFSVGRCNNSFMGW